VKSSQTAHRKLIRMENLRRLVQILCFIAFVYLFVLTIGEYSGVVRKMVLTSKAPIDTFFRMTHCSVLLLCYPPGR